MHVLLVEDEDDMRALLEMSLMQLGSMRVTACATAAEALRILGEGDTRLPVDIVLSDIQLPDQSGIELCRQLRTRPEQVDTPIILMTAARNEEELVEAAFAAGATDFLSKPVRSVDLRARVRAAFRLRQESQRRVAYERELVGQLTVMGQDNERLQNEAERDFLTGLFNRRYFENALARVLRQARVEQTTVCVALFDVDFFKSYNDACGHPAGDRCLYDVGQALARNLRGPDDIVARYGGEEFVLVLPGQDYERARHTAQALRMAVRHLAISHPASPIAPMVTISAGLVCVRLRPELAISGADLIQHADHALYRAKHAGRDRAEVVDLG